MKKLLILSLITVFFISCKQNSETINIGIYDPMGHELEFSKQDTTKVLIFMFQLSETLERSKADPNISSYKYLSQMEDVFQQNEARYKKTYKSEWFIDAFNPKVKAKYDRMMMEMQE